MQVLRVCSFSTFALPPAFPPCCCPLAFRRQVRRLTSRMSSESYPGYPECVVSCHGAGTFANSIPPIFETCLFVMAVCNFSYINQLCGQSQILVSQIKVSILQSWRVYETERRTVLGLSWLGLYKGTKKAIYKTPVCRIGSRAPHVPLVL